MGAANLLPQDAWFDYADIAIDLIEKNIDVGARDADGSTASDLIDLKFFEHKTLKFIQKMQVEEVRALFSMLSTIKARTSMNPLFTCLKTAHHFRSGADGETANNTAKENLLQLAESFSKTAATIVSLRLAPESDSEENYLTVADKVFGAARWAAAASLRRTGRGKFALKLATDTEDSTFLASPYVQTVLHSIWRGEAATSQLAAVRPDPNAPLKSIIDVWAKYANIACAIPRVRYFLHGLCEIAFVVFYSWVLYKDNCNRESSYSKVVCSNGSGIGKTVNVILSVFFLGKLVEEIQTFIDRGGFKNYIRENSQRLLLFVIPFITITIAVQSFTLFLGDANDMHGNTHWSWEVSKNLKVTYQISRLLSLSILWVRLLYCFTFHNELGLLLRVVATMIIDLSVFMWIMILSIIGFAYAIECFLGGDFPDSDVSEEESFGETIDYFNTLSGSIEFLFSSFIGEFEVDYFGTLWKDNDRSETKMYLVGIFYLTFLLISNVMLLNCKSFWPDNVCTTCFLSSLLVSRSAHRYDGGDIRQHYQGAGKRAACGASEDYHVQ